MVRTVTNELSSASLHTIFKSELKPGVALTCIKTDKFKSGCITVNFLCKLNRENASANALLPRVLRRGSMKLPDMESISAALDDLYGVRVEPITRKKGEMHCTGLYADFPDDRYIPDEDNILEKSIGILGDMLLSPYMFNGFLCEDYTVSEKSNLLDDIHAAINDKRGYAIDRLLEEMCCDEAFGISKLGSEKEVAEITCQTLTEHYYNVINTSRVEVLYCGPAEPNRVQAAIEDVFKDLPERPGATIPETSIIYDPLTIKPRRFTDKLDVTQGKLTIGFRMGEAMKAPDYPAFMMLNALYGGSVSSKLFHNVREKLALCYYASSMLDKHKGVMLVSSGVDFSKFDAAFDEILAQLDSIKNGNIREWEFNSAKSSVKTSIQSALDRVGGLEELYFDSAVSTVRYDPVNLNDMIDTVTPERVVRVASGIKIDSIYRLTGINSREADE